MGRTVRETLPEVGQVFTVRYPFVHRMDTVPDESRGGEDFFATKEVRNEDFPWKAGTEFRGSDDHGNAYSEADAIGSMTLTVVSVHKPGKYPTRVFYTRRFTDPDGKEFGKGKCHIATLEKFRRLSSRYQHSFDLKPQPPAKEPTP